MKDKPERRCGLCERASLLDEDTCLCPLKGVVSRGHCCRAFRRDLFKLKVGHRPAGTPPFNPDSLTL